MSNLIRLNKKLTKLIPSPNLVMIGKDKKPFWYRKFPNPCKLAATSDFDPTLGPEVENLNTITEFFNFFVDDYIIDKIVDCTNKKLNSSQKRRL